jgi:hypothetical protein
MEQDDGYHCHRPETFDVEAESRSRRLFVLCQPIATADGSGLRQSHHLCGRFG